MRKNTYFILIILASMVLLPSCNKRQSELSKEAYAYLKNIDESTSMISHDIYQVWSMAIYEDDGITIEKLDESLYLNKTEIQDGLAKSIWYLMALPFEESPEEARENASDLQIKMLKVSGGFSDYIDAVINAYTINGEYEELFQKQESAKLIMKELSQKYSSYEHFQALKEYYTTVTSFLELCYSPEGSLLSFQRAQDDYIKKTRNIRNDLDLVFSD